MYEVVEMSAVVDDNDAVEHDNDELVILLRIRINVQVCSMDEAEEMLAVVDRNGDGVISYSEFRCMMGANPILL